jgi:hypothetical protein
MFWTKFKQLIFIFSLLLAAPFAIGGPDSGGGGVVGQIEGQWILIDFFNIPGASAPLLGIESSQINKPQKASFELKRNKAIKNSSFQVATQIFEKWEAVPFDIASVIIHGGLFSPVKWQFVENLNSPLQFYRPQSTPEFSKVRTAAYYRNDKNGYTVHIERELWNQLSAENQVGLVVHEGLRHIQLGQKSQFNDETLQKATAIMMLCQPSVKLSQYLYFLIMNQPELAEARFGSFTEVTEKCGQ